MFLVDYHTHTRCSPDSTATLAEMVEGAARAGLQEICTTDHCDLIQPGGGWMEPWDWTPILEQYRRYLQEHPKPPVTVLLGIELGGAQRDPKWAQEIIDGAPLDLVVGSVHTLSERAGGEDLFYLDYTDPAYCREIVADYMESLVELSGLPTYDILGHSIYPLRYILGRGGHKMTMEPWMDRLDEVFRNAIHSGRGIEVNTHYGKDMEIWRHVLVRYRQLGGEIITVSSDAHRGEHVGGGVKQAADMLRELGFGYLTRYRQRKPEQVKL